MGTYRNEFWQRVAKSSTRQFSAVLALVGLVTDGLVVWALWGWIGRDISSLVLGQLGAAFLSFWLLTLAYQAFRGAAAERNQHALELSRLELNTPVITYDGPSPAHNVIEGPGGTRRAAHFTRVRFINRVRPGGVGVVAKKLGASVTIFDVDGTEVASWSNGRWAEGEERIERRGEEWLVKPITRLWDFDLPAGKAATLDLLCQYDGETAARPWSNDGAGPPLTGASYFVEVMVVAEGMPELSEYFVVDLLEGDSLLHHLSERPSNLPDPDAA